MHILKIIFIFIILNFNAYSETVFIQLLDSNKENAAFHLGPGDELILDEEKALSVMDYDNFLNIASKTRMFRPLHEILTDKRKKLYAPLIISTETDFVLLDQNLEYIITKSGEHLYYEDINGEKGKRILSKEMMDSFHYLVNSEVYGLIQNECTDKVFTERKIEEKAHEKIMEFLHSVKETNCDERMQNGQTLSNYLSDNMDNNIFKGCLNCLLNKFSPEQLEYYLDNYFIEEEQNICKKYLAEKVLTLISKDEKEILLHKSIEKIKANLENIKYDHNTFGFTFKPQKIRGYFEYVLNYLTIFGNKDFNDSEISLLTKDTNTLNDNSRKEVSDILAWVHATKDLKLIGEGQNIKNMVSKEALKRSLIKTNASNHQIRIFPISEEGKKELGENGIFVTCGTSQIDLYNKVNTKGDKVILGTVDYFYYRNILNGSTIPLSHIAESIKLKRKIYVNCSGVEYELTFDNTVLKLKGLNLEKLKDFHFKFGEDNTINALSTIGLVNEMSQELAVAMTMALNVQGFQLNSQIEVENILPEFLKDLELTDIYMPINHAMSLEYFHIGSSPGIKFIFTKKINDKKTIVLKLYTPSFSGKSQTTTANHKEIIQALSKRKVEDNNLFVLNLSCNAQRTIPQWMHAYTGAIQVNVEKEILPPIVISSTRAFGTSSALEIMSHMEYPFGILKLAEGEATISDVLDFLNAKPNAKVSASRSFAPEANVGKTYLEKMKQRISGSILKPDGTKEAF